MGASEIADHTLLVSRQVYIFLYKVKLYSFLLFTSVHFCHRPRTLFLQASDISCLYLTWNFHNCRQKAIFLRVVCQVPIAHQVLFKVPSPSAPLLQPLPCIWASSDCICPLPFHCSLHHRHRFGLRASVQFEMKKVSLFSWTDNSTTLWSFGAHWSLRILLLRWSWFLQRCGGGCSLLAACCLPGQVRRHVAKAGCWSMARSQ